MEVRGQLIQHKSRRKWCQQISSSSQEKITLRKLSLECCSVFCACLCAHVRTKIIVILSRWSVLTPSSCVWLQRQTVCAKSLQLNRQPNQALQDTAIARMNALSTNPAFVIPCNFVLFAQFFQQTLAPFTHIVFISKLSLRMCSNLLVSNLVCFIRLVLVHLVFTLAFLTVNLKILKLICWILWRIFHDSAYWTYKSMLCAGINAPVECT